MPDNAVRRISVQVSDDIPEQPLRWATKPTASTGATTAVASYEQPLQPPRVVSATGSSSVRGWNRTRIDGAVRPAQAISDPFQDPFGDKRQTRQVSDLELVPTPAEAGEPAARVAATPAYEVLPAPAPRPIRTPATLAAPVASPAEPEFVHQPEASLAPAPPSGSAMPSVDLLPSKSNDGTPCDRVYNNRNCCDIESGCRLFRQQLLADSIRNISLDITPDYPYHPEQTSEQKETLRNDELRLAASRAWRSKAGEVLATGRMTHFLDGRVVVSDDSGREIARIPWRDLGDDELCFINAYWKLPVECALGGRQVVSRHWIPGTYQWTASALCHKPLYFEEVQLERYGHTAGPLRQPIISGAHFFLNVALLPYHMAYQPPHECQYALGYYRPGNCAPWMIPPIPLSLKGALTEAGFIVGGIYVIP